AARQRVADAIRAVPFDPAELGAAFDVLRQKNSDTAASLHLMLSELIARLDDEERAAVADTIRVWRPRESRQDGERRDRSACSGCSCSWPWSGPAWPAGGSGTATATRVPASRPCQS